MISNIKELKLGDVLISLRTGLNPRKNFALNTHDAKNWYITVRELNGTGVDFLPQTDKVNDVALALINNRSHLEVGDVLFSGTGTIGKTAIISESPTNWNIKEGVYVLKPNRTLVHPYYLLCQLNYYARLNIFGRQTGGSTVFSIPMQVLAETKILLPSIDEQNKIASIIKNIDEKIELNNKINAELEQTARLIYDYWFTQFDFPDAQGKPYKSSGGAMVYNDQLKREIPAGWMDARIKDFNVDIITGKTPSTKDSSNFGGDIPFITIDDIRGNPFVISTSKTLTEKGAGLQANKFLPKGSLCVTCIATPGLVGFTAKMSQTNQQINTIVFHSEESKYYLYFGISDHFKYSAGAKTGNTFANMNKGDFENILLSKPPIALIETYHNAVTPLFNMIHQNLNESHELIQLRDWLLPMLMTGQVKIGD